MTDTIVKLKEGGEDGDFINPTDAISVRVVHNGFILFAEMEEGEFTEVYTFNGKKENGPLGLMNGIIELLGLKDKIQVKGK